MESVTVDGILSWLKDQIESKQPIPPHVWMDSAAKLNVLLEDIDDELAAVKMKVNEMKYEITKEGVSVAAAKVAAEASTSYAQMMKLESKRDRIKEHIRIAKKRAELREWE